MNRKDSIGGVKKALKVLIDIFDEELSLQEITNIVKDITK